MYNYQTHKNHCTTITLPCPSKPVKKNKKRKQKNQHSQTETQAQPDPNHPIWTLIGVLFLCPEVMIKWAAAQPSPNPYQYTKFNPSTAIIAVVLSAALFFMGFFSIYIRHCSQGPANSNNVRMKGLSWRTAVAGLMQISDGSVEEERRVWRKKEEMERQWGERDGERRMNERI